MDWSWRVGVLRPGAENIAWVRTGVGGDWCTSRAETVAALTELVAREGRQEYRLEIGGVVGIVNPGLDEDGNVDTTDLGSALPLAWE